VPGESAVAHHPTFTGSNFRSTEFGGGGEAFESGDGFDEASDRKGVADPTGFADEVEDATFARQRNRNADQRGDAGAVNLRDAIEVNDHLAAGFVEEGVKRRSKLIARFAYGKPSMHIKDVDAVFVADVDFDGSVLGHGDNFVTGWF